MGCACAREGIDAEEKLKEKESLLPYSSHESKFILVLHKKYSQGQSAMSKETWLKILEKLYPDERVSSKEFYECFENPDKTYPYASLCVMGILLSNGSYYDKSQFLFEVFDKENKGHILYEDLRGLISTMLEVSIDKLPLLLPTKDPRSKTNEYVNIIKRNKAAALNQILAKFENTETVSASQFQSVMVSEINRTLLTSSGLRIKAYNATVSYLL
jgi:Ca2+-binding EF-hand superfamily protein